VILLQINVLIIASVTVNVPLRTCPGRLRQDAYRSKARERKRINEPKCPVTGALAVRIGGIGAAENIHRPGGRKGD
jgi:hypothetical protein